MLFCFRNHLSRVFRFGMMFREVGFNIRLLGSMLGLDMLRRLGRKWRSIKVSVHRLNIRVVGCPWNRSLSRNRVGLITWSRFRSSLGRVGRLNYIRLGCFFEGNHFVSERLHCLQHGRLEYPHFLLKLDVKCTTQGFFKPAFYFIMQCSTWGGWDSLWHFYSTLKVCLRARERITITIVTQQAKIIFAIINIRCFLLPDIPTSMLYFDLLFLGETSTDISWRLVSDTGIVSLARFPTSGAIIV